MRLSELKTGEKGVIVKVLEPGGIPFLCVGSKRAE